MALLLMTNPFTEIERFVLSLSMDIDAKKFQPVFKRYQTPPKDGKQQYQRQKASRAERVAIFSNDPRIDEFFTWLFSLKDRAEMTTAEFAKALGVSPQSIKMYKNYE